MLICNHLGLLYEKSVTWKESSNNDGSFFMPESGITPAEGRTGNTTPHTKPRPSVEAWAE